MTCQHGGLTFVRQRNRKLLNGSTDYALMLQLSHSCDYFLLRLLSLWLQTSRTKHMPIFIHGDLGGSVWYGGGWDYFIRQTGPLVNNSLGKKLALYSWQPVHLSFCWRELSVVFTIHAICSGGGGKGKTHRPEKNWQCTKVTPNNFCFPSTAHTCLGHFN